MCLYEQKNAIGLHFIPVQTAEASSEWSQLLWPQSEREQLNIVGSVPSHLTLSNHIWYTHRHWTLERGESNSIWCTNRQENIAKNINEKKRKDGGTLTLPLPAPYIDLCGALRALTKPSSRQTTLASISLQWSSHTVPHSPSWNTSTRPSPAVVPFTSRTLGPLIATGGEG